jgi:hypothetical protein
MERVFFKKIIVAPIVKIFSAFYGTQKFITVFTRARHLLPSKPDGSQAISCHPVSLGYVLVSSHMSLRPSKWFSPFGFLN